MRKKEIIILQIILLPLLSFQAVVVLDSFPLPTKPTAIHETNDTNLFLVARYDTLNVAKCRVAPNAQSFTCDPSDLITTTKASNIMVSKAANYVIKGHQVQAGHIEGFYLSPTAGMTQLKVIPLGYEISISGGCVEGKSFCFTCPSHYLYSGVAAARITRFDTGAAGYDGEFETKSGLSEEINCMTISHPNFVITSSLAGRYTFIDPTFPAAGIIVSSGQLTITNEIY